MSRATALRVRRLREQLGATAEYVYHLRSPIIEGYRIAPVFVEEGLTEVLDAIDRLEGGLFKIDKKRPPIGGAVKLVEEWAEDE